MAQLLGVFCREGAGADGGFIVCDAFACVGGNTLAFARLNFSVFALEVTNSEENPQTMTYYHFRNLKYHDSLLSSAPSHSAR